MKKTIIKSTKGSLDLRGTSITQLPENLTVGGSLDLRGTSITQLPENLTVGGWLDLSGTSITQLPENLTVGGLQLEDTQIKNVVYGCGDQKRAIHPFHESDSGRVVISLGCFVGTKDQAIYAIKQKYRGKDADDYIAKVNEAFANYKPVFKSHNEKIAEFDSAE